ncbi:MAG: RNA polymerase sigma factor [Bacteroidota bacterium]
MDINDLVKGCLAGNQQHFDTLYDTYSKRLYHICMRYSGDEDEAKDILQDGFIKVFVQLKTFDMAKGTFDGWIKRIFVNTSIDYFRKKSHNINSVSLENVSDHLMHEDENDEPVYDLTTDQIMDMVRELPTGYRLVFNLYVVEEMSHKQIATMLGISENTSKTQLFKAKKALQRKITEHMMDCQINSKRAI